jgi:hypothetical protein
MCKKVMKSTEITYLENLGNFVVSGEMWKRRSMQITQNCEEEEDSELM